MVIVLMCRTVAYPTVISYVFSEMTTCNLSANNDLVVEFKPNCMKCVQLILKKSLKLLPPEVRF